MSRTGAEQELFQALLTLTPTNVYAPTLTQNGQVDILTLFIANSHSSAVKVNLCKVPDGGTADNSNKIFPAALIPTETLWLPYNMELFLKKGQSIWVWADVTDVICITANGKVHQ